MLGIETSCDDTGVGVVEGPKARFSERLSSAPALEPFGGVVPEVASRWHLEHLPRLLRRVLAELEVRLDDFSAVAVTVGPGLVGPLLVGLSAAKGLAKGLGIGLIPVNHLEAHALSPFVGQEQVPFPYLALLVSGGHTELVLCEALGRYRVLGRTADDAAGEVLDKVGREMGLGYPAGPEIERLAEESRAKVSLPVTRLPDFVFSFSGLKTAALRALRELPEERLADLAAGLQEAVFAQLEFQLRAAVRETGVRTVALVGGVAANRRLREKMERLAREERVELRVPPPALCTDNGLMVAFCGYLYWREGQRFPMDAVDAVPDLDLGEPLPGGEKD